MSIKLYVGNLSFQTSSDDLQKLFAQVARLNQPRSWKIVKLGDPAVLASWRWLLKRKDRKQLRNLTAKT